MSSRGQGGYCLVVCLNNPFNNPPSSPKKGGKIVWTTYDHIYHFVFCRTAITALFLLWVWFYIAGYPKSKNMWTKTTPGQWLSHSLGLLKPNCSKWTRTDENPFAKKQNVQGMYKYLYYNKVIRLFIDINRMLDKMFLQNASKFAILYWTRKLTFML